MPTLQHLSTLIRLQSPGQQPPKSAQVCLLTGNNIQIQLFYGGTNPKLTPQFQKTIFSKLFAIKLNHFLIR